MADTATKTLAEFIAENQITMTCTRVDSNPSMPDSSDMDHWKCVLARPESEVITLRWKTRDLGNGSDSGTTKGTWGEMDGWGKRAFFPIGSPHILYLFPDEIKSGRKTQRFVKLTVPFSMGYGHNGREPELSGVLDCLASDASGIENAGSFEDWCSEYGYDADSRKAEKVFKACEHSAARLKRFLGDAYSVLLWNTERE